MFIALEQGQTAPRGQNFDGNRKALSLYPFVASFKKSLGQGLTTPWEQNFDVILSFPSFVGIQKISFKSDFIQFFFMI